MCKDKNNKWMMIMMTRIIVANVYCGDNNYGYNNDIGDNDNNNFTCYDNWTRFQHFPSTRNIDF